MKWITLIPLIRTKFLLLHEYHHVKRRTAPTVLCVSSYVLLDLFILMWLSVERLHLCTALTLFSSNLRCGHWTFSLFKATKSTRGSCDNEDWLPRDRLTYMSNHSGCLWRHRFSFRKASWIYTKQNVIHSKALLLFRRPQLLPIRKSNRRDRMTF